MASRMLRRPLRMGNCLLLALLAVLAACRPDNAAPVAPGSVTAVKLFVAEDGLYRVPAAGLRAAGLDPDTLATTNLRLTDNATTVPFLIQDDALLFYGRGSDTPYTAARAYVLQVGESGTAIAETAVDAPAGAAALASVARTAHFEENTFYSSEARTDEHADLWFWHELQQQSTLPLQLDLGAVSDGPARLRLNLWGFTYNPQVDGDHDFDVLVNGRDVGSVQWDGQTFHTAELNLPAGVLQSGINDILLDNRPEGAAFLDIMQLNWLELDYSIPPEAVDDYLAFDAAADGAITLSGFEGAPLVLDVSNPTAPLQLTGFDATLPISAGQAIVAVGERGGKTPIAIEPLRISDWRSPEMQADLLIVTTDELAPALEPLVAARAAQGTTAMVVPVADLYDAFAGGNTTPEAIRQFVAYALENWQAPGPRYLFLVGDASTDYRNYLGTNPPNLVPSLLVPVDASGETVSDSRLVDVDGDMLPDLAVGRWPVSDPAQVKALVARTLAYESGTAVNRTLFAADGSERYFADIAGRLVSDTLPAVGQNDILSGPQAAEVAEALNAGPWLATYIGHGSITQWGKDDVFTLDAVKRLRAETPPIVLQLTCLTGLFAHPEQISLAEQMLLHDTGPVLTVAATSLTYSMHQEPFAAALMTQLQDPAASRIGDAFQAAKRSLNVADNGFREVVDTFALFGDPSAVIIRPD